MTAQSSKLNPPWVTIAFKKIVFEQARLSGPGPFGREATAREHCFRGLGALEQGLLDLHGQRLTSRAVVHMGVRLCALLPELCKRVVIRRIGRQREDLPPCRVRGAEGVGLGAGVIRRPILKQQDGVRGVLPSPREQGPGGGGVEAACLPWINEAPGDGRKQPEDVGAVPLAGGLDLGWLTAPRPGVRERTPRRARRCIAEQPQGRPRFGQAQHLGPRRGTPRGPRACLQMRGDEGRLWLATAPVLQPLGDGEDGGEEAPAGVNHGLEHRRTPAGAAAPGLDRPLVKPRGTRRVWRRGQLGWAATGLWARHARDSIAAAHAPPGRDGLLVHTQDQGDRRNALAVHDREDGEALLDLASVAQWLGRLPLACHCCTVVS
jgi:hypothetical protein